jgi:hypothetical protein
MCVLSSFRVKVPRSGRLDVVRACPDHAKAGGGRRRSEVGRAHRPGRVVGSSRIVRGGAEKMAAPEMERKDGAAGAEDDEGRHSLVDPSSSSSSSSESTVAMSPGSPSLSSSESTSPWSTCRCFRPANLPRGYPR